MTPRSSRRILSRASLMVAAALLGSSPVARAASIYWDGATTIGADTQVITGGSLLYAYTASNTAATVNTVAFTGVNSTTTWSTGVTLSFPTSTGSNTTTFGTPTGVSAAYGNLTKGATYGGAGTGTVTLKNLVSAHVYATQIWVSDSRANNGGRTETVTSAGGNSTVLDYNSNDAATAGGAGQFTTGRFLADAATQAFTLTASSSVQLNALQVRDITNLGNWVGTGGASWDATTTNNFATNAFDAALVTTTFDTAKAVLGNVTFGDHYWNAGVAVPVTQTAVTVGAGGVSAGRVYFDNAAVSYVLSSADANGISGTTAVMKLGAGTVTFAGANTYTGLTTVGAGSLKAGSNNAFTSKGGLSMYAAGIFDLNGFNAGFTTLASASTNLITNTSTSTAASSSTAVGTPSGAGVYVDAFTLSTAGQTIAARLTDGTVRETQLIINNANSGTNFGGITNTANSFSGGLVLLNSATGTRLRVNSAITGTPFGTGPIIVGQAATDKAQILLDSATPVTLTNDVWINTAVGTDAVGALRVDTAGHVLSGRVTANLGAIRVFGNAAAASLSLNGQLTGPLGLAVETTAAAFTVTLNNTTANANNYVGDTVINQNAAAGRSATLRLGAANQIPSGTGVGNVTVTTSTTGVGMLDLNGFNQKINGLSGAGTIDGNAAGTAGTNTLTVGDNNVTSAFSGPIRSTVGSLALTKIGTGTLTLSGANTYAGGTNINGGTVTSSREAVAGGAAALGSSVPSNLVTIGNGGILTGSINNWLESTNLAAGGTNARTVQVNAGGILRGAANSVITGLGNVTLNGGTIEVTNGFVSGGWNGSFTLGGELTVSGTAVSYITTASGAGAGANLQMSNGANGVGGTRTFRVNDVTSSAASDLVVSANLASGTIVKEGAGTLELATGATGTATPVAWTVNAGTLSLAATGGTGRVRGILTVNSGGTVVTTGDGTGLGYNTAKPDQIVINGGTVTSAGTMHIWDLTGGVQMTGGTLQSNQGTSTTTGSQLEWRNTAVTTLASAATATIAGRLNLRADGGNGISFNVADGAAATDLLISAAITQSGTGAGQGLSKSGNGTLTLSGVNSYAGATTVTAGTLVYQNTYASASHAIDTGAILELNVATGTRGAATTTFSGGGTLRKTGAGEVVWNAGTGTFALGSGSLIDVQAGTFVGGSGANEVWTNNRSDLNIASGATFSTVEANVRVNAVTGSGSLRTGYAGSGYQNLTIGVDNGTSTFAGVIADASAEGHLVKQGSGVITLSGANTFTGTTTIGAGTLKLTNNLALQSSAFNTAGAGTLDLTDAAIGALTLGGLVGDAVTGQALALPANVTSLTLNPATGRSRSFLRDITGGATGLTLTKTGGGTQALGGINPYSGVTTFGAGILNVGSLTDYDVAGSIGQRAASSEAFGDIGLRFMGGTLQYTGATAQSTNRQIRIGTSGGTIDASGSAAGATVTFAYNGANTDLFDTGGPRTLTLTGSNTGANTFAIGLGDENPSTGKTSLTKSGNGTWILTGTHTYTGATSVTGGTLNLATSIAASATTLNGATAVLTGLGTAGNVTLTAGSIRPGDGSATGVLNVGALSIAAGQSLGHVLGTPGTSSRVAAASLALPATGAPLKVSLTDNADAGGNGRLADGTYSLVSYSGALTGGNAAFGRTLNVVASPLTNRVYAFANTGTANGAVTVTIARQSPVILQDSFARTGVLGGTTPVVAASSATGATWTSAAGISTDSVARSPLFTLANQDSATLGFLPQAGNVYTLSANLNPAGGTASNWLALGFANSAPPTTSINANSTLAWMLQRNNNTLGQSYFGGGTSIGGNHSTAVGGSEQTNTIVLDARNGLANATLYFLVNGVAQRAAATGFDATAIANVIIGNYQTGGTVRDLTLTAGSTWLPVLGINSWDNVANWSAGYRPGAAESIAVFAPFLGTVGQTVTLDADQTVGQLAFANSIPGGGGFTVAQGTAGTLTFDNGAAGARVSNDFGVNRISAPVILNDTLTVDAATGTSLEMSGPVGQTGGNRGLTKNGNGVLTLSGANTYAGTTTVNGGTLRLVGTASAHAASALVINAGATLDLRASLTVDSLTFNGATTANIAATGTSASLLSANTLYADAVTLNITGAAPGSWTSGTYPLFAYGSLNGAGFLLGDVAGTTSRTLSKTLTDTGGQIALVIVNDTPKWTGIIGSDLDNAVGDWWNDMGNWRLATSGGTTDFLNGDAVVFDDTATGVTSVNIDYAVTPSAVVFDNTAKDYVLDSLSGVGIGGGGSLTKRGTGRLEIRNQNSYTGPTLIERGTLALVGISASLGPTSALTLAGGSLDLGASNRTLGSLNITHTAPDGTDTLANGGLIAGSYAISNAAGNAVLSAGLLESGLAGLDKTGAGTATLAGANTYRGPTLVSEGTLALAGAGTLGTGSALSLLGGRVDLGGTTQTVGAVAFSVAANAGATLSNGSLRGTSYAAGNTTGNLLISANLLANGSAGFAKTGAGSATLSGNNTFTGPLTLAANSGVLTLSGDNSARPADAQGLTTVNSGATLRLQANEANTVSAVSTALSSEQTAAQPLLLNNGSTLQLRGDASVTFAGANNFGGLGGATVTIDVGRLTSAGSGNTLSLAPGGFNVSGTTFNVTGADDYVLRFPSVTSAGANTTAFNPTSANLSLGVYTASVTGTSTLGLAGTSTGNVVTGAITNGTGTLAVTKSSSGVWTLSGANTYTGATTVSAGTLKVGSADAFTNKGALALSGTGVFDLNGFDAVFAGNVPAGVATNLITDNAGGSGTSVLTFRQATGTGVTTAAQITDGPTRKVAIAFANNNGSQQFTNAANTFTGGLTLLNESTNGTRLQVGAVPTNTFVSGVLTAGPYGTGPITVGLAATDKAGIFVSAANATIANPIVANTTLGTDRVGTFRIDATGLTLSGLLTAGASDLALSTNGTGSATLTGRITGANGLRLLSHSAGGTSLTVTLASPAGANDYNGNTTINSGAQSGRSYALELGAADQIPNGAGKGNVSISTNGTGLGTLRLQGFSDTINGLTGNGGVTTTVAGASVLTLGDGDATASFTGTITESVGTIALVKIGSGTQTLAGLSTYSGGTAVNAGTLTIDVQGNQTSSALGVSRAVSVASGATLRMTRTDGLGFYGANPSSLIIGGTMTIATGIHASIANFGLTLNGGTIASEGVGDSDGNYIFDGAITTQANAASSVISANTIKLRNGSGAANQSVLFNVADGSAATDLSVSTVFLNGNGANGLTKNGNGTLHLAGASTYTGATMVNGGTLRVNSLGTTGASSVGASDRATAANLLLSGAVTLEYAGAGEATSRSFTVAGTGLTLASSGAGAVMFTSASQIAFAADGASARELRLAGSNTGDNTFGSTLSGTPLEADTIKQITKNDVGTWVLSGPANRFHGDVRVDVNGGTLGLTSGALNTSGAGLISINAHSTLRWETGNVDDLSGRVFIADGAQAGVSVTAGVVSFASALQLGANKSGTLLKVGNGTLKLAASQEVAGITVSAGLLDIASGATVGAVTVNNGGTLGGKGSTGAVTVASGGIVSPGSSPGALTHASLTLSGGSIIDWEVYDASGTAGVGYDRLVVTGDLDLTGAGPSNRIRIKLRSLATLDAAGNPLNFGPPDGVSSIRTFQFGQAGGLLLNAGQNISDVFAFDVTDFRYSDGSASHAALWSIDWNAGNGAITLTAVPEPSTYGLGLGALALAAAALRRRRRQAPKA